MMLQHISNHGYIMQFLFLHHTRKDLFHRESKRCKANNDDEIRECSAKQGIVVISAMQWYTNQASSCIGDICWRRQHASVTGVRIAEFTFSSSLVLAYLLPQQSTGYHWFHKTLAPSPQAYSSKLALTTYKILSTHQPAHLRSLLFPYEPTRALRSSSQQLLNVQTATTDFGRRAFSYCVPKIWYEIPAAIRNAPTVQIFKHRLKTHLFTV